ncbi:sensor domain-containing protein [Longispora sp. NPDC051575]|uniref:sensor histidine kinase n=1 Tax=Longispora sp. NPDC051575 TaxID=3154943 RepID=UPI00343E1D25
MTVRTGWQALTQHPLGFLASAWPWRSLAYLVSGVLTGVGTAAVLLGLLVFGVLLTPAVVGLVLLAAVPLSGLVVARFERWRMLLVDRDPAPDPHRPPDRPGVRAWLRTRVREQQTWQELGYVGVSMFGLWWLDFGVLAVSFFLPGLCIASMFYDLTLPWYGYVFDSVAFVPLFVVAAYPVTVWAGARAALTRAILSPREAELGARLGEVSRSRARLVDAYEVERRRIERDLHDGAQQRLVALTVQLGLARLDLPPGSPAALQVGGAHEQAKLALAELRELIRGVHPQILTDRGLPAAAADVAGRSPVPVTVDLVLDGRLPASVEAAAYFVITESLANVAKHSRAGRAVVRGRVVGDRLVLEISDDGVGGADVTAGSGLAGLADRAAAANGTLTVTSPTGGPTLVRAELSCLVE